MAQDPAFTIGEDDKLIEFYVMANEPFEYSIGQGGPDRLITLRVKGGKGPVACDALYGVGDYYYTSPTDDKYPRPHRFPNNTALTVQDVRGKPLGPAIPDGSDVTAGQLGRGRDWDIITAHYGIHPFDTDGSEYETSSRAGEEVPWSRLTVRAEDGEIKVNRNSILSNGVRIPSNAQTLT